MPLVMRAVLALALIAVSGCEREPEPRLRIGTFPRPGFEPFFLARSLGCYDDQRMQFVEFPSAAEMLMAYRNRAIDAATVTTDDVLRLAADGEQLRIVLVLDYSNGIDALLAKPEIRDVPSLRGHTISVESNSLGAYILARALDAGGLTEGDVKIISTRADRMDRDLSMGATDAVVSYEPYRTKILSHGAISLFDSAQVSEEIAGFLIVPAALAEHPPAALRDLATGWFQALVYLGRKPDDAAKRVAIHEGLTPKQFTKTLELLRFATRAENERQLRGAQSTLPSYMGSVSKFMFKRHMLKTDVDPEPLRSDALLREEN